MSGGQSSNAVVVFFNLLYLFYILRYANFTAEQLRLSCLLLGTTGPLIEGTREHFSPQMSPPGLINRLSVRPGIVQLAGSLKPSIDI